MKKYKLIKEYPGSPELGDVCEERNIKSSFCYYFKGEKNIGIPKDQVENQPEYWEEIRNILFVVSEVDYNQGNYNYFQAWTVYKIYEDNKRDSILNYFKTKEEADDFVLHNKPCLSYSDIVWFFKEDTKKNTFSTDIDILLEFIKSKL
jgi:hypothetical protein